MHRATSARAETVDISSSDPTKRLEPGQPKSSHPRDLVIWSNFELFPNAIFVFNITEKLHTLITHSATTHCELLLHPLPSEIAIAEAFEASLAASTSAAQASKGAANAATSRTGTR